MGVSRIKGITVEISGETTGLDKALKSVNTTIKSTQTQLKDVERLLKLDPSNTELLSQKQRLLKEAIGATKEKLESLKTATGIAGFHNLCQAGNLRYGWKEAGDSRKQYLRRRQKAPSCYRRNHGSWCCCCKDDRRF